MNWIFVVLILFPITTLGQNIDTGFLYPSTFTVQENSCPNIQFSEFTSEWNTGDVLAPFAYSLSGTSYGVQYPAELKLNLGGNTPISTPWTVVLNPVISPSLEGVSVFLYSVVPIEIQVGGTPCSALMIQSEPLSGSEEDLPWFSLFVCQSPGGLSCSALFQATDFITYLSTAVPIVQDKEIQQSEQPQFQPQRLATQEKRPLLQRQQRAQEDDQDIAFVRHNVATRAVGPCSQSALLVNAPYADDSYARLDNVRACLNAIDIDTDVAQQTLDVLAQAFDTYPYRDINKNSPSPANVRIDILGQIDAIREDVTAGRISGMFQFQQRLRETVNQMRDTHTLYRPACGFLGVVDGLALTFVRSIFLGQAGVADASDTPYRLDLSSDVDADGNQYIYATTGSEWTPWTGLNVLTIDGVDAVTAIQNYADAAIPLKDAAIRFNHAIGSSLLLGTFCARSFTNFPDFLTAPDSITIEFQDPVNDVVFTETFEWFVSFSGDWNTDEVAVPCGVPSPVQNKQVAGKALSYDAELPKHGFDSFKRNQKRGGHQSIRLALWQTLLEADQITGITASEYDGQTGLIKIPTFSAPLPLFFTRLHFCYHLLRQHYRYDKIMVDVSDNGGGFIANGIGTYFLLTGSEESPESLYDYDIIHSELYDAVLARYLAESDADIKAQLAENYWLDTQPDGNDFSPPESFYTPGKASKRGGSTSTYTAKGEFSLVDDDVDQFLSFMRQTVGYTPMEPSSLIIVTNGFCGSTCGFFLRPLRIQRQAKIIGFGGLVDSPMDTSSFTANVRSWAGSIEDALFFELDNFGFVPVEIPSGFPSRFQIVWFEPYDVSPNVPAEFIPNEVDARVNTWDADFGQHEVALIDAASYFDCCFSWEPSCSQPCDRSSSSLLSFSFFLLSFITFFFFFFQ